jgi:hypothetical protein
MCRLGLYFGFWVCYMAPTMLFLIVKRPLFGRDPYYRLP